MKKSKKKKENRANAMRCPYAARRSCFAVRTESITTTAGR